MKENTGNNWNSLLTKIKTLKVWEAQSKTKTRVRRFTPDKTVFLQFKIPREDDSDIYKQNSPSALRQLITLQKEELNYEDMAMMEHVASDLDRTMSVENIIGGPKKPSIPKEVWDQIERLPSWLQSMVIHKYPSIHAHFSRRQDIVSFFRAIANRIDRRYRSRLRTGGNEDVFVIRGEGDRDYRENNQLNDYSLTEEDVVAADREVERQLTEPQILKPVQKTATAAGLHANWKKVHNTVDEGTWRPRHVSRANLKLRAALQTRAAYGDLVTVAEDEDLLRVDQSMIDSDDDENAANQMTSEIFDFDKTMEHAEIKVEKDLTSVKKVTQMEKQQKRLEKEMIKRKSCCIKNKNKLDKKTTERKSTRHHFFVSKKEKRKKKRILLSRGYYRDFNRLFHHNCGEIQKSPSRRERTTRCDDSFHNFCVALVLSGWFKWLIIIIISLNAIMLLVETSVVGEEFIFEIMDHIFVALYLIEFAVKIYAHPYGYWKSGFNIFDFVILISSLVKTVMDWTNVADLNVLRVLLIIRALRVLRGISLSVQLQVLVSALVHTIKTHALSVVILLVILLYLVSIIAFFLFGHLLPSYFGTVGQGMLTLVVFLTIDGWTNIHEQLAEVAGTGGTVFSVICIVLGNFLFSNIFVAIIITNISEATDNFRDKQREQRETVVRMKKEKVFHRQKLDLHQLFARQRTSAFTDFFSLGQQFQTLLRHDDIVAMTDVVNSPLWIDSVYQSLLRSSHTSNILMNLHREVADNLTEQFRLFGETKHGCTPIRRGRFKRYINLKAKLSLIKQEILNTKGANGESRTRIKLPEE